MNPKPSDFHLLVSDGIDDFPLGYFKGHVDIALAVSLARKEGSLDLWEDVPGAEIKITARQTRARLVPTNGSQDWDYTFLEPREGRGSFPCTVIEQA